MLSTICRHVSRRGLLRSVSTLQSFFNPTEEHQMLRESVRAFAEEEVGPQAEHYNRIEELNYDLFRKVGDMGLLGCTVPEEYGGVGFDATASVIIHEELAAQDPAFCLSYLAHSVLFNNNLARNGSEEQCLKYLPGACSGEKLCGMAMTEPQSGTDVLTMKTTAVKDGDNYIMNGCKIWITNCSVGGELGDYFLVYAKTGEKPDGRGEISLFVLEKGMEGFSLGQKFHDKLGMRASPTGELVFEDCVVPAANLVGREGGAIYCMMRNLELERLTLAAMSLGIARRSVELMVNFARDRQSFGTSILNHGQIQRHVAESYAEYMAMKTYIYGVANQLDIDVIGGAETRRDSDGVKLFGTTAAKNIADRAIQVMGGYGYTGEYVVERLWRDAKLLEIGGGTVEAHQKNITRDLADVEKLE